MSEIYQITLRKDLELFDGRITLEEAEAKDGNSLCKVMLSFSDKKAFGEGEDFFDALIALRQTLEREGIFLLIYGASRNVWPSSMSRNMGAGTQAYRMEKGRQALRDDLVNIFETGPDIDPCTIAEQEKYKDEWLVSL